MAYNVLKGKVEGSVDQYGDQEIKGRKVFKNAISASVFYDTSSESPCATIKDLAIKKIDGKTKNGILTYNTDGVAKTSHNLIFDGECLRTNIVKAKFVVGSAVHMSQIPANQFNEKINAAHLNFGRGLHEVRKELQIRAHNGLGVDEDGVGICLSSTSGLSVKSKNLVVDITKTQPINREGQNISDQDMLLISDVSRKQTNNTTVKNLFDSYIKPRIHKPSGNSNEIQFMYQKQFSSSGNLTFDKEANLLLVDGKIKSNIVNINNSLRCAGSVYHNISSTTEKNYHISDEDYTILCDASENKIKVSLPPAVNHTGRVIVIKKANSDKYKLNSNHIEIVCAEGRIDINDAITIKMNYSSRTLQSDGENWWIIGTKGS